MTPFTVGLIGIGVLFLLLLGGLHIGVAMGLVGFIGMIYISGWSAGLGLLKTTVYRTFSNYDLTVIPLFILMGEFCFRAGLSKELYGAMRKFLGGFRGGLAMTTVAACAAFAAVSGSSLATAATMGTVALAEMKRYKYDPALSTGSISAGGTIGILIPPSVILILYGILTEQSIGKLFLGGFIPGVLEALFYIGVIYILCKHNPLLGPPGPRINFRDRIIALKDTRIVLLLFVLIIGGIYLGVFSPTEAAGVGATVAFFATLKRLSWKKFKTSIFETIRFTSMIFLIVLGATIFGYFLAVTRLPFQLAEFIGGLPVNRYIILLLMLCVYILLGCVMDSMAMILLTVPIFFPVARILGFDPIWFGIIIVRVVEMGLITPPVGLNVYIVKGVAKDIPLSTIFRGIIPFLIADICHVALLIAVPQLTLFLPSLMR